MEKRKIKKKETVEDVKKGIQGAMQKINRSREKAYILQQLFDSEAGAVDQDISIDHIGLLLAGAETILGEIVTNTGEASEYLLNLTFSKLLKSEVPA